MKINLRGPADHDSTIFDRIDVIIGNSQLTARPIDFNLDQYQNPVDVLKYETTCPDCGGLVHFDEKQGDITYVKCPVCQKEPVKVKEASYKIEETGQQVKTIEKRKPPVITPWVNPIDQGLFDPNQLEFAK